jgi:hypothetical protein
LQAKPGGPIAGNHTVVIGSVSVSDNWAFLKELKYQTEKQGWEIERFLLKPLPLVAV